MKRLKIYLDNCCFNRPYDDQSQLRISLETQAKLFVQDEIKKGELQLVTSYILWYENSMNPYDIRKTAIKEFITENTSLYIDIDKKDEIKDLAESIMKTGIKTKDAYHVACAIYGGCDVFLSTDDRLLKYKTDRMDILNPMEFIRKKEGNCYDE